MDANDDGPSWVHGTQCGGLLSVGQRGRGAFERSHEHPGLRPNAVWGIHRLSHWIWDSYGAGAACGIWKA